MEKERPKPLRTKHRNSLEQIELSPALIAPLLTDFINENVNAENSEETKENKLEVQERFLKKFVLIN